MSHIHHAYCYTGHDRALVREKLFQIFEKDIYFEKNGNPDFHHISVDSFGIDDSRNIKELQGNRSMGKDGKRIFLIEANSINNEAQNALLKVLEEPQAGTYFFLNIPRAEILLPTLRSRLQVVNTVNTDLDNERTAKVRAFLNASIRERIVMMDSLAGDIADDKKEKQTAIQFMNEIEMVLVYDMRAKIRGAKERLATIVKARDYMTDRSPSMKQLLEYVALSV